MPAVARIGESFDCGDIVKTASPNVFCNGIPVARKTDATTGHGCWSGTDIKSGSGTVFVNNLALARAGDPNTPHTCSSIPETHGGNIVGGSPDVQAD